MAEYNQGMKEARVQYVEELMRTFRFKRGTTSRALAKDWGVTLQYVWTITAEASKRISAAVTDPEVVNAKVCSALDEIIDICMAKGKYKEVIEATKAWAHISGSSHPVKHEITGQDGGPVVGPVIFIPPEDSSDKKE